MAKRTIKANDLTGLFIYQNTKNGTVWYDWITKKGYIITSQEAPAYTMSSMAFPAAIVLAYFCNNLFNFSLPACIAIGVAVYLIVFILYRVLFFYKLPEAKNWVKPKEGFLDTCAEKYSKPRLIALIILFFLVVIVSQIGIQTDNLEGGYKVGMNIMTIVAGVLMIGSAAALKKKMNKEKK